LEDVFLKPGIADEKRLPRALSRCQEQQWKYRFPAKAGNLMRKGAGHDFASQNRCSPMRPGGQPFGAQGIEAEIPQDLHRQI
jgi:hypothetical protein